MNKNIGDMTRSELIDYVIELQEENSGYERKIDKAIERIRKEYSYYFNNCDDDFVDDEWSSNSTLLNELMDILKGNKWNKVEIAYLDDKPIGSDKE